jgi:hypothetical protein
MMQSESGPGTPSMTKQKNLLRLCLEHLEAAMHNADVEDVAKGLYRS